MIYTVLIFIVLIAVLVLVHEAGHFFTAKAAGIRVEEFGFGFPPRIVGIESVPGKRFLHVGAAEEVREEMTVTRVEGGEVVEHTLTDTVSDLDRIVPVTKRRIVWGNDNGKVGDEGRKGTVYSLNWIPLGGFVRILGEEGGSQDDPRSFASRGVGVRSLIIVAGVLMNLLLAMALFSIGNVIGLPTIIEDGMNEKNFTNVQVQIVDIAKNSPADSAGLAIGDTITGIGGRQFVNIGDIQKYVNDRKGQEMRFSYVHDGVSKTSLVTPRANPPAGEGPLGFSMVKTGVEKLPIYIAVWRGITDTFSIAWLFLKAFGGLFANLFTTGNVGAEITGPVGIAVLTGRVAKLGLAHLLQFAGAISVNLALINIFPIPALDGGRFFFLILEKIKGRPISRRIEQQIHQVGFAVLLMLMLIITVRDVIHLF
jgi:regulator of sigma E protease